MGWLISSILITVIVFVGLALMLPRPKWVRFLSLLCLLIMLPGFIGSVPTGYTGILTSFGKVLDDSLDAGVHFLMPWYKIVNMDNRTQKGEGQLSAFSSDLQQVDVKYSVNYSIDKTTATDLYRNVGVNYYNTIVAPRLSEVIKTNFGSYTAENMIPNRMSLSDKVTSDLRNEMVVYGITITTVNIEDIDFTDAFTNAVEAKQVATQEKLRAETEQAQLTYEAEQAAERQKINAQANADVAKIAADAEAYAITAKADADAAAYKKLSSSLTGLMLEYIQTEKWNGVVPETLVKTDLDVNVHGY